MSGGFFRGTSADQDTRFSNKQAQLMKSQKFAPELEQLVDITKVKMDVMRPWIATRVTELLGFEDEVLINFIYGLLEGKVGGKQIQIQLTGFMEKNTGKFMKELWNLLLSAQKNASGVPQQFLDAKEEELKKKKGETDRLVQEVQRRKERGGWGPEPERKSRMDDKEHTQEARDEARDVSKNAGTCADSFTKQLRDDRIDITPNGSLDIDGKHTIRRKNRRSLSPHSANDPPSSPRRIPLPNKSPGRSVSRSRSYSSGSRKSRSLSISPRRQRRSISREKQYQSHRRRSISPRRLKSPLRRQSPYSRHIISHSRHRSPSLSRRRSPIRRRSRSPLRHQSPARYKSPSPVRRPSRSPLRRRSPVYIRRRSPSPVRRRFPARYRSPMHDSPSPLRRASPIPRSPKGGRSPIPYLRSPRKSHSPSYRPRRSPGQNTGMGLRRARDDRRSQISPSRHCTEREEAGVAAPGHKREILDASRNLVSSKSPRQDTWNRRDSRNAVAVKSVLLKKPVSPVNGLEKKSRQLRNQSMSLSPDMPSRNEKITSDVTETVRDREETSPAREVISNRKQNRLKNMHSRHGDQQNVSAEFHDLSPDGRRKAHRVYGTLKGKRYASSSPERVQEVTHFNDDIEYGPGRVEDDINSAGVSRLAQDLSKGGSSPHGRQKRYERGYLKHTSQKDGVGFSDRHKFYRGIDDIPPETAKKAELDILDEDLDSEDDRKNKGHERTTRYAKDRDASTDEAGYDSQVDELKERKRKRKDKKQLKKEEKRHKREERHRRKEERRALKQKNRHSSPGSPSDYEKNCNADNRSNDGARVDLKSSDNDETESEQKKLEIQLREKALESLRAKKAITN